MDPLWVVYETQVLGLVETDLTGEMFKLRTLQQAAMAAYGDSEVYKYHVKMSQDALMLYGECQRPDMDWSRNDALRAQGKQAQEEYEKVFGKLDDPKVADELAKMEKMWKNRTAQSKAQQVAAGKAEIEERKRSLDLVKARQAGWRGRIRSDL